MDGNRGDPTSEGGKIPYRQVRVRPTRSAAVWEQRLRVLARAGGAVSARADWRPNRFLEPGFAAPANSVEGFTVTLTGISGALLRSHTR